MKFWFNKGNGNVYYSDENTEFFIMTTAKTTKEAWKVTHRMVRERSHPVPYLRLVTKEVDQ